MNPMKWPERFKNRKPPSTALTLLVLIPTRRRWASFERCARSWFGGHDPSTPHKVRIVCLHDQDDQPPERLPFVEYHEVPPLSKVAKWNRVPDENWDVLVMMGDDTTCEMYGWDYVVAETMLRDWPNLDGALSWHQGFFAKDHIVHPIVGKNLWVRLDRKVWNEEYVSFFCDNELSTLLKHLRRVNFYEYGLFEHHHPLNPKFPKPPDAIYKADQRNMQRDWDVFAERCKSGVMTPEVTLSVLIPSLSWRWEKRQRLLDHLNKIIAALPPRDRLRVEVRLSIDCGEKAVSTKRNDLIRESVGKYVVFVDDDDLVSDDYFTTLLPALDGGPDAVVFEKEYFNPTMPDKKADYVDKRNKEWGVSEKDGRNLVTHLAPIKRNYAILTPFDPGIFVGEDFDFAKRIKPYMKNVPYINKVLYQYLFDPDGSTCAVASWGGADHRKKPGRRGSRRIERVRVKEDDA